MDDLLGHLFFFLSSVTLAVPFPLPYQHLKALRKPQEIQMEYRLILLRFDENSRFLRMSDASEGLIRADRKAQNLKHRPLFMTFGWLVF